MRKETQKSIENFEFVFDTLFPDGDIPSFKDIQEKTNAGTLTYREAQVAKLYTNGSLPIKALTDADSAAYKALQKSNPGVIEKAERFYGIFGNAKSPQLMSGVRSDITVLTNKIQGALDTPFSEIQASVSGGSKGLKTLIKPISVFDEVIKKVKAGRSVEGMEVGGTRIFQSIPDEQALKELLGGIKNIPDDEVRQATYLALLGYRGTALQGISSSFEAATEGEDVFPYFDPQTEQIVKPDVRKPGKKPLPPTSKPGPVAVDTLKFRMANVSEFGELFPNVTRDVIAAALNEHVYPNLSKSTIDKLGRMPSGFTDMRRFFASAIANLLGDAKQASVLIGHTAGAESLEAEFDKVLTNHYARLTKAAAKAEDVRHKTLFAYESILARVLGKSTSNDLAQFLNLPFEEGVTARYSTNDVDILTGDGTAPPVTERTPETPEEAEARTRKNVALDNQIAAEAELANVQTQKQIQAETAELAAGADEYVANVETQAAAEAQAAEVQAQAKADVKADKEKTTFDSHFDALKGLGKKLSLAVGTAYGTAKLMAPGISDAATIIPEAVIGRATAPPLPEGEGPFATALTDPYDIAVLKGQKFAEDVGLPRSVGALGAVAGEAITGGAISDPQGTRENLQNLGMQVGRLFGPGPLRMSGTDTLSFQGPTTGATQGRNAPRIRIPDAVQPTTGTLSAGNAKDKVNLATRAAEQGEETTMTGAFINGPNFP
tara:strand:+ start:43 stop:2202 length:2160 start_codon:yes stop_codon:yes gene_type:complete